jgi:hypothetical protein
MGFFSRRRKRESAIPEASDEPALGSFANPAGQPVVGQQVGGGQPAVDLDGLGLTDGIAMLAQLGPAIQQAIATGNVQITQGEPQILDMRGSGLREEIMQIMEEHGIDARAGTASQNIDASTYGNMQQQILEALAKHGIDPNASGSPINFQISPEEGEAK